MVSGVSVGKKVGLGCSVIRVAFSQPVSSKGVKESGPR